jgi:hypothetical protein
VAEDGCPHGAGEEARGEGAESEQGPDKRVGCGEEELVEHESGSEP